MTLRFVNTALLIFTLLVTLTGVYGIVWVLDGWMYEAHRIFAWALVALLPWKTLISLRSLKRGFKFTLDRGLVPILSIALTGMIGFVFLLGLMWAWRLGPERLWLRETVLSWHWILALVLIPPFIIHTWRRWPKPKQGDLLSRRGFLKLAGLSAFGAAGWWLGGLIAATRHDDSAPRRITGSRLDGYFSGNQFPVTTGAGDGREKVDLDDWRLTISGAVAQPISFTYDELLNLPEAEKVATLDCTIGWYTVQRWAGLALPELLAMAKPAGNAWTVQLGAVSGYAKTFTFAEAAEILLATHVGGEVLAHQHGFPLRAVVPSRRGWFWVKWLTDVEVLA
jgi:hypothetical protein